MFKRLVRRIHDVRTIRTLCAAAEGHANAEGKQEPGAEHFLLATLDLPDGTARRALQRVNADPSSVQQAIVGQYKDSLGQLEVHSADVDGVMDEAMPVPEKPKLYRASASGQLLMQHLAAQRANEADTPLLGAHVLVALAQLRSGVAIRALHRMGVDLERMRESAMAEITTTFQRRSAQKRA